MKTHTEEEFKKLLKTLFAEKKRVKQLRKKLEAEGLQKSFQTKLTDIQKLAAPGRIIEKDQEILELKQQLDKAKNLLRRLAEELKERKLEIGHFQRRDGQERVEAVIDCAYVELRRQGSQKYALMDENGELRRGISGIPQLKQQASHLRSACEEQLREIKKAQTYLAKKVRETTILRDLVEKQKLQIEEEHEKRSDLHLEIERLNRQIHHHKSHEQKLDQLAKERSGKVEEEIKMWQQKYLDAQQEIAQKKQQIEQLLSQ